jgi:hypothetical protein
VCHARVAGDALVHRMRQIPVRIPKSPAFSCFFIPGLWLQLWSSDCRDIATVLSSPWILRTRIFIMRIYNNCHCDITTRGRSDHLSAFISNSKLTSTFAVVKHARV